jgi:hypothetical protein
MKKSASKSLRKGGRRTKDDKPVELDRGWHELEQQHDRLKSDWMSLAAQLNIAGREGSDFE